MIILSYHQIFIFSFYQNTKWLKSFSVPSLGFRHILSRLPPRQGSLPQNKRIRGNNFLRRTCQWRSNLPGSSKTLVSWKQKLTSKKFEIWKMKSCKSSETRFAKVSRRSELCSGGKRPFEISNKIQNSRNVNSWTKKQTCWRANHTENFDVGLPPY